MPVAPRPTLLIFVVLLALFLLPAAAVAIDTDGDGLEDANETAIGTNPLVADTDLDGLSDGAELGRVWTVGYHPLEVISAGVTGAAIVIPADVDGDGDEDVIWASTDDDWVAWHENVGGVVSSTSTQIISTLDGPISLHAKDLDADGHLDLLAAARDGDEVVWFENTDGLGMFVEKQVINSTVDEPRFVSTGDIDGDGDPDVLTASPGDDEVAWYENTDGLGTFGPKQVIAASFWGAISAVSTDIDADGDLDIVSHPNTAKGPTAHLNTAGDGSAWTQQLLTGDLQAGALPGIGDIDGDGYPDLVASSMVDSNVRWYENGRPGSTGFAENVIQSGWCCFSKHVVADLDGDSDVDVFMKANSYTGWYVLENQDSLGSFGASDWLTPPIWIHDGTPTDLDGDGQIDLLVASATSNTIAWYRNPNTDPLDPDGDGDTLLDGLEVNIHGTDPGRADSDFDGLDDPGEIAAGTDPLDPDTDDDGLTDSAEISVHSTDPLDPDTDSGGAPDGFEINNGFDPNAPGDDGLDADTDGLTNAAESTNGTDPNDADSDDDGLSDGDEVLLFFSDPLDPDSDDDGLEDAGEVLLGGDPNLPDTDGDGLLDGPEALAGTSLTSSDTDADGLSDGYELGRLINLGFDAPQLVTTTTSFLYDFIAADMDGDGDLDVVVAEYSGDAIKWHENGDGIGTFSQEHLVVSGINGPRSVHAADADGDGDLDLFSASELDDTIAWYENTDGYGTFGPQQILTNAADRVYWVHAADLDGDGDNDLIAAISADHQVAWYENTDGIGTFGPANVLATTHFWYYQAVAADVDRDGDNDIVAAASAGGHVSWFENLNGLGAFGIEQFVAIGMNTPNRLQVEDMDEDGDLDVFASGSNAKAIEWYENSDGDGTFSVEHVITSGMASCDASYAADLDGDGDVDALGASRLDANLGVSWYENENGIGGFGSNILIQDEAESPRGLLAADIDGDGFQDALVFTDYDDTLAWRRNPVPLDPLDPDVDDDGLLDGDEVKVYGTGVWNPDTDGDGTSDGDEVHIYGTDPNDAGSFPEPVTEVPGLFAIGRLVLAGLLIVSARRQLP